jgi:cell division GTPase FtsZ
MTTMDENMINIAEEAVEAIDETNLVDTVIDMGPTTGSSKGALIAKVATTLVVGVGALAVYLVKTKETRKEKRKERAAAFLEKNGYTVTKKIIEAEAVECEDEDVDYEGDDE